MNGRLKDARGDSIVEVLIAMAIISLILVGAFVSVNRSTATVRDTQEHQEALALTNAQLELVRKNAGIVSGTNCYTDTGTVALSTGHNCDYTGTGQSGCTTAAQSYCYHTLVTVAATDPVTPTVKYLSTTYKVSVTWTSLLGNTGSTTSYYRVSIPNPTYTPPSATGIPGALGVAHVGNNACDITSSCTSGTGSGGSTVHSTDYHFRTTFYNLTTDIPDDQIDSCIWNFGDGTIDYDSKADADCHYGGAKLHDYTSATAMQGLPDYPAACLSVPYQVTLTIVRNDGTKSTSPAYTRKMPVCY